MDKIGIITDTNSGLTEAFARQYNIGLLPMPIMVNGEEYFENVDISQAEFFKYLEGGASVSTSQPAPGNVMLMWDEALKKYDQIIYVPMSSALSGACENAKLFAQDYNGRVFVVDNRRISVSLKQSVLEADLWRRQGLSAPEIVRRMTETALDASIYLTVNDLNYLKKGGRITPSVAAIGTVLNIKPVILIQGGKLDTFKKVRGPIAARNTMIEAIRNDIETSFKDTPFTMYVAYAGDEKLGLEWKAFVESKFPEYEVHMDPLPLSIACHTGPGTVGVGVVRNVSASNC